MVEPGLWRYDVNTGVEDIVIDGSEEGSLFHFVGWPMESSKGNLNFFYSSSIGIPQGDVPLLMVRSAFDAPIDIEQIRPDSLQVQEVLWAPDGSLALIIQMQQNASGPVVLAKTDSSPLTVLINNAENLQWGP